MKKKYYWTIGIVIIVTILLLILSSPLERISCTRESDCPANYQYYSILSGGMGPQGALPIEPIGGDMFCHKSCNIDSDCPFLQTCKMIERCREDYCETISLCFSWFNSASEATPNWAD